MCAQKSILWTTGGGGDGAAAYTQAEVTRWQRQLHNNANSSGVYFNYEQDLEVTGAATPVNVGTGGANVYGFPCWNTTTWTGSVSTPATGTRKDRIVVRADWSSTAARLTHLVGTTFGGGATAPAISHTADTRWDIPLATLTITVGGAITVTDEREYVRPAIEIHGSMLDSDIVDDSTIEINANVLRVKDDGIDDTKAGNRIPQFYRRQGGSATDWSATGGTSYTPTSVRMQSGCVQWSGGAANNGVASVTFPVKFGADSPLVFVQARDAGSNETQITHYITGLSSAAVDIAWYCDSGTNTTVDLNWFAVGPE